MIYWKLWRVKRNDLHFYGQKVYIKQLMKTKTLKDKLDEEIYSNNHTSCSL